MLSFCSVFVYVNIWFWNIWNCNFVSTMIIKLFLNSLKLLNYKFALLRQKKEHWSRRKSRVTVVGYQMPDPKGGLA